MSNIILNNLTFSLPTSDIWREAPERQERRGLLILNQRLRLGWSWSGHLAATLKTLDRPSRGNNQERTLTLLSTDVTAA